MKFFCLCMSPAIDATVSLPRAPKGDGEIFKDVAEEENVGGKAVNVARWLAIRGAEVACGGLLGEDNDRPFVKELAKYAIADSFVRVPGATRRNEMVVWPGSSMKLNRAAFPGLSAVPSLDSLLPLSSFPPPAVAILSGSLPPSVPKDFYAKAVARLKALDFTVVLDASGAALTEGVKAHPDIIKPNAEECAALVGFVPKTRDEFLKATDGLRKVCGYPIISDGGAGAWFDGEFVAAPAVDRPTRMDLVVELRDEDSLAAAPCTNSWPFWVFPATGRPTPPANVAVVALGSPEEAAARKAGKSLLVLANQTGPANFSMGWWNVGAQVGTAILPHPVLGDFPYEPYLSPLLFRMIKEGSKLPVPGWDEKDMVIVGEGLKDAYLYLGAKTLPDGRREVLVSGLDVTSDTPEGRSLLANALKWLGNAR